ncbi:hypothetical protein GO988_18295 [Hymenobacter sp. HMF4947]|uniref:DUF6438 domain-containing protein n=1 Tax=Hymenobacter ginkgonis TaxID=2682976 RepID=A0A7K1TIS0_9BACT|nr:DUF6438 domain-containing protein [Hymenobacter ginkgonis]MVN78285.1 hypothetical protein [Hymenobacter ginkgonis]
MRSLSYLLALSLILPACAQKGVPQKSKATAAATAAPTPSAQAEPVLVFQRTPCYGTCPAYTATIFADGRVEYEGQRFVPVLGKHTLKLPVATVNELLAGAKRINFNSLEERYSRNTSDLPATIITVHPVGQPLKAVFADEGIPANLQGYINLLKARLDPLSGVGVTE